MARAEIIFWICLSFLGGVFFGQASLAAILILAFLAAFCLWSLRFFEARNIGLIIAAALFGFIYFHGFLVFTSLRSHLPETEKFMARVVSDPQVGEKGTKVGLKLEFPHKGRLEAILNPRVSVDYGDRLELSGTVFPNPPRIFYPEVVLKGHEESSWVKARLFDIKRSVTGTFRNILPSESAALLSGLMLGTQSDFSEKFKEEMVNSGTIHLVALSGYNIAIIIIALRKSFGGIIPRRWIFWLVSALIPIFVTMVGGSASVVRAALMGWIAILGEEIGRPRSIGQAIVVAAFFMALLDPRIVRNDLGFQLSFLSLLGIVYLKPLISKFFGEHREETSFFNWRANFYTTAAAQIFVLPLIAVQFGTISLSGFIANLFILELVPLTMALGFILISFSYLSFVLGAIVAQLVNVLLLYERFIIHVFAQIPRFSFSAFWFACGYYFILAALLINFYGDRNTKK